MMQELTCACCEEAFTNAIKPNRMASTRFGFSLLFEPLLALNSHYRRRYIPPFVAGRFFLTARFLPLFASLALPPAASVVHAQTLVFVRSN